MSNANTIAREKIIRLISTVVFVCLLVFSLFQVGRTTFNATPGRRVTLNFLWPTFTPQKVRYGEYLAEQYMELHPDVQVNLILTPDPSRKMQVMIAGNTAPDVAWLGVGLQQFGSALLPLDTLVAQDPEVRPEDYNARLWEAVQWRGCVRALPSSGQTGVIYYNKDMFDEAGLAYPTDDWTWREMEAMAAALTKDFDGDGMIDQYGVQLGQMYLAPFFLYDGQIANDDWTEARVDTQVTRDLLDRYQQLIFGEQPVMASVTASAELGMLPMFEAGRTAMHASSGYAIETFRKTPFDWDVVPFPRFEYEGASYRATGLWQEAFGVMWDTEHPVEAWEFVKWCSSEKIIGWAALHGHIVPGRTDVAASDAYLHSGKRPANMNAFIQSQGFSVPIYPHPWWRRIAAEFEPSLNQYNVGSEGVQISAAQMLEEMQASLQQVLDEYQAEYGTE